MEGVSRQNCLLTSSFREFCRESCFIRVPFIVNGDNIDDGTVGTDFNSSGNNHHDNMIINRTYNFTKKFLQSRTLLSV